MESACDSQVDLVDGIDSSAFKTIAQVEVVLGLLLTVMVISVQVWRSRRCMTQPGRWRSLRAHLCEALSQVWSPKISEDDDGAKVRELVRERVDERHLRVWKWVFERGVTFSAVALVLNLLGHAAVGKLDAVFGHADGHDLYNMVTGLGMNVCALFVSAVFAEFPRTLTKRSCYGVVVLTQAYLLFILSPYDHSANNYYHTMLVGPGATYALIRLLVSLPCSDTLFVIVLTVVSSVANVILSLDDCLQNSAICPHSCFFVLARQELIALIIILAAWFVHRHLLIQQVQATIAAKNKSNEVSSVTTLLYGMCDAVVHLNEDFTVRQPSAQLDSLLFSNAIKAGEKGPQNFLNFLNEDRDKEQFCNFIPVLPGRELGQLPGTLHIAMRDAFKAPVHVQLFHTQCVDAVDERFHIIGIRENGDLSGRLAPSRQQIPALRANSRDPLRKRPASEGFSMLGDVSINAPVLTLVAPGLGGPAADLRPGDMAVWVDTTVGGLPMMKCTHEFFTHMGGPSLKVGSKLLAWSLPNDRKPLEIKIQALVNELLEGRPEVEAFRVLLRVPCLAPGHVEADLKMSLQDDGKLDGSSNTFSSDRSAETSSYTEILTQSGLARAEDQEGTGVVFPLLKIHFVNATYKKLGGEGRPLGKTFVRPGTAPVRKDSGTIGEAGGQPLEATRDVNVPFSL